ncbi:MAG TPA: YihY/virulence factor BrkB family protein [Flavitalea sp.]|nr:YihY/virulence factor BrkB family protein [Flavitalea sp.]
MSGSVGRFMKRIPKVLLTTFKSFSEDKGLKLSAALAYYTVFAMGPLLLLLISVVGFIYGKDATEGKVFNELNGLLGNSAAAQIQEIIKNIELSGQTNFALVISIVTLIIGATSVFIEIQDSINMVWKLKTKPKRGWVQFLKNRLISSSLIISLGFLLVVSLIVNGVIEAAVSLLSKRFSEMTQYLMIGVNYLFTFIVIMTLFAIIFKFLPDAKIRWKHVRSGAIFTAILFMIGRYLIGLYITKTGTESTYGAAGSIVIILVWIYYSAVILYLGAEFTQVYTAATGGRIEPAGYAVQIEQREIEREGASLPVENKHLKREN